VLVVYINTPNKYKKVSVVKMSFSKQTCNTKDKTKLKIRMEKPKV
jgi:hypothetical protein